MKAFNALLVTMLSLALLQGCSAPTKIEKNDTGSKGSSTNNKKGQSASKLSTCLYEADSLVKINIKYQEKVNVLYNVIKDAKYYATISSSVTENVRETITPLYKFKVNDICNDISQSVLSELKDGIK